MSAGFVFNLIFCATEGVLVLAVIIAICYYITALRAHKTPTKPGAVIDLCGISAIVLPIIWAMIRWRLSSGNMASVISLTIVCLIYGVIMGADVSYLHRAAKINKEVNAKKERRKKK